MSGGYIQSRSLVGFARSGIAIAARSGSSRVRIDSEEAVRQAVLAARSICYSTGPSGDHVI
ncbi:hypothetical protein [Microvirga pakistanensis]|uniref:hypothetical protein n=1 Tax=Microvirga pakistanensis TaxID=1682650 RepID=UPI003CC7C4A1